MPNVIRYSASATTESLRKDTFYLGVGDVGKGSTDITGFWNGIDVPDSGFNIYLNKNSNGPSIYSFSSQTEYLEISRSISGIDFTGITQSLTWFASQTDKAVVNRNYEQITTSGLVVNLDAGFTPSYPGSGTTSYNLGTPYNATLLNGVGFDSWVGGRFILDGSNNAIQWGTQPVTGVTSAITYSMWFELNAITTNMVFFSFRDSLITLASSTSFNYWADVDLTSNSFSTSAITTDVWYHMALVQSGTTTSLYLNGVLQSSGTTPSIGTTRNDKAIGQYDSSPGSYPKFNGSIANAFIYNRALTSDEIQQNYNVQKDRFVFVSSWKTDNAGTSTSTQISLPLISTGSYNMLVDWGDGTTSTITSWTDSAKTHTYSSAGTYTVKITGRFTGFQFNNGGDRLKILEISRWGCMGLNSGRAFYGCQNLVSNDKFAPLITSTSFIYMFFDCYIFNGPINSWNLKTVTELTYSMYNMFNFNQYINDWDVSSVTSMGAMFRSSSKFNQDIGSWNTGKNTDFGFMFDGCGAFNNGGRNTIRNWDVSKGTSFSSMFRYAPRFNQDLDNWVTSSAVGMAGMFAFCTDFNGSLSNFVTSGVTDMNSMLRNCDNFNQNLSNFVTSKVTNMRDLFYASYSFKGYGLENWDVSKVTNFIGTFGYNFNNIGVYDNWNFSSATQMNYMFIQNYSFVSNPSNWNVSNVVNMDALFQSTPLKYPLNSWDVRKVSVFTNTFLAATSFNHPLDNWVPTGATTFAGFMNSKSQANYNPEYLDGIYNNWSQLNVKSGVTANFGTIKYTSAGAAGRAALIAKGWTITDGGQL